MDSNLRQYRKRIDIAGIPVDAFSSDDLEKAVKEMLADKKNYNIMLVSLRDIILAKFNTELRSNIERAELVLPISSSILFGAKFLKRMYIPELYFPFDFVIKLLGVIENHGKSVYLVGGRRSVLQITESNIKSSFPGLNIVGRCAGFFQKEMEKNVVTAIKKSSPALILAGVGLSGGRHWITRNMAMFNPGIMLWIGNSFDIFAGRRSRPAKTGRTRFAEKLVKVFKNPVKILNIFIYVWYFFVLLYYRIRGL